MKVRQGFVSNSSSSSFIISGVKIKEEDMTSEMRDHHEKDDIKGLESFWDENEDEYIVGVGRAYGEEDCSNTVDYESLHPKHAVRVLKRFGVENIQESDIKLMYGVRST